MEQNKKIEELISKISNKLDLEENFEKYYFNCLWKFFHKFKYFSHIETNFYKKICGNLCGKIKYQGGN